MFKEGHSLPCPPGATHLPAVVDYATIPNLTPIPFVLMVVREVQ
jgi:hypothetical protein